MTSQTWWYVARSGGLVAWALASLSVLWGFVLSSKLWRGRASGPKLLDLHRFLGGLAVVFTGVHLLGLFADSYTHYGPVELFVPMASDYRPGAVAWGVVGFYLLLAVEITSLLRNKMPERLWRALHFLSIPVFVLGTVHGLLAGTDTDAGWAWWPGVIVTALVVAAFVARLVSVGTRTPNVARPGRVSTRERVAKNGTAPSATTRVDRGEIMALLQSPYRSSELGMPVFGTLGGTIGKSTRPAVDLDTTEPDNDDFDVMALDALAFDTDVSEVETLEVEPVELTFTPGDTRLEVVPFDPATIADISVNDLLSQPVQVSESEPGPSSIRDPAVAARIDLLRRTYARLEQLDETGSAPHRPVVPYLRRLSDPAPASTAATPLPAAPLGASAATRIDAATRLLRTFTPEANPTPTADDQLAPIRALPTRVTRLHEATSRAFAAPSWTPAVVDPLVRPATAPRPPDAIDPETGEPDMTAYRRWLHEWLTYVESHPA
jgi:DMSO/TMAO reductase YedYZ heme-binding membrane subunit